MKLNSSKATYVRYFCCILHQFVNILKLENIKMLLILIMLLILLYLITYLPKIKYILEKNSTWKDLCPNIGAIKAQHMIV